MSLTDSKGRDLRRKLAPSFLARQEEAMFWEAYVGARLAKEGLYVVHEPMHLGEYYDPLKGLTCDLRVSPWPPVSCLPVELLDVEVKSRQRYFHKPADLGQNVFICNQQWFLNNFPGYSTLGRDFLLVSKVTGHILWAAEGTEVTMGVDMYDDERQLAYKGVTVRTSDLGDFSGFVTKVREMEHGGSKEE